jgi:hypothetical protein
VSSPKFDAKVWVSDVDQTGFTINVKDAVYTGDTGEIYWIAMW